jgi:hypothetical protein
MAYDDNSPQMNIQTDPHRILQDIADLDAHIEEKKAYRRQLVSLYEETMEGFHKHANEVLYRPLPEEPVMAEAPYQEKGRW